MYPQQQLLETVENVYRDLSAKVILLNAGITEEQKPVKGLSQCKGKTFNELIEECLQAPWIDIKNQDLPIRTEAIQEKTIRSLLKQVNTEMAKLKMGKYKNKVHGTKLKAYHDLLSLTKITLEQNVLLLDMLSRFYKSEDLAACNQSCPPAWEQKTNPHTTVQSVQT